MDDLVIPKTAKTLGINFDANEGVLEISGISIPEDSQKFFDPVFRWLEEYKNKGEYDDLEVKIKLDYFNTSTSRILLDLFRYIASLKKSDGEIFFKWYFEEGDMDMEDTGNDYKAILADLEFEMIEIEGS